MEMVDVLAPPDFRQTGEVKTIVKAWEDGNWIRTFNLWIVQSNPAPTIVYQVRSPKSSWAPEKLDVTAGGHYSAGEKLEDGMREVREELGVNYEFSSLLYLGQKMQVSIDVKSRERKNIVEIFIVTDNRSIKEFKLEESEVYAVCACPLDDLYKIHTKQNYTFEVELIKATGETEKKIISKEDFPFNWDNYHFKIVLLAKRFLAGERDLIY